MIALLVSYFLLTYLLVPRAIFRWVGVFLPLKFQRTRTEEVAFAFWVALIPLIVAVCIALAWSGAPSAQALGAYKEIFAASYSEAIFDKDPGRFWCAVRKVGVRQTEFLTLYYLLVIGEAALFVFLVRRYGTWRSKSRHYGWFVREILLRGVSEWYLLLTVANFPRTPTRKVEADLLISEDHLYQGEVADYFIDAEGALSGLTLENPRRFDRPGYLRAKRIDPSTDSEAHWREIPSSSLYISREKILNLNLRYPPTEPMSETAETATKELISSGIDLKVEIPADEANVKERQRKGEPKPD
jgi:hypothetical protein